MADAMCEIGHACAQGTAVFYPGSTFFIAPDNMTPLQLLWTFTAYGYVLFVSANMIGDGAELLLLIPDYKDLVASVVLPILGAVPDGMMVLFSGVGPLAVAQENVAVGVGALAGSTIMLLTLPWVLSFFGGKVDMNKDSSGKVVMNYEGKKSARDTKSGIAVIFKQGIEFQEGARQNAKIMMLTSLAYLFIQIPASLVDDQKTKAQYASEKAYLDAVISESSGVQIWAAVGTGATVLMLALYLAAQVMAARAAMNAPEGVETAYKVAVPAVKMKDGWLAEKGLRMHIQYLRDRADTQKNTKSVPATKGTPYSALIPVQQRLSSDMEDELRGIYKEYSPKSANDGIHRVDMHNALIKIGLDYQEATFEKMFSQADKNNSDTLDEREFLDFFSTFIINSKDPLPWEGGGGDDDDDDDEMPDEFKTLNPTDQRKAILKESCYQMLLGTVLVLIFSDPMVDVLSEIGSMTGVPAFYVSFVLAPLASNASELVASYKLAAKKTSESITQSLQTLEGAAIMNNTFCLGIFYVLIYMQGLAWKFTAETASIVLVQILVGIMVLLKSRQTILMGIIVFLFYPLSLVFVATLEAHGID